MLGVLAPLQSGLEHLLGGEGLGGGGDGLGVRHGVGQGGLEIDVLARLHGGEGDVPVQVRRGGNDDGLDVGAGQDLAVILDLPGLRRGLGGAAERLLVMVAQGHDGRVRQLGERGDDVAAMGAEPDDGALHRWSRGLFLVAGVGLGRGQHLAVTGRLRGGLFRLLSRQRNAAHRRKECRDRTRLHEAAPVQVRPPCGCIAHGHAARLPKTPLACQPRASRSWRARPGSWAAGKGRRRGGDAA